MWATRTLFAVTGAAVGEPLKGHTDYVRSTAYSPDGRYIISGSDDRTIRIWDAKTGAAVGHPLKSNTYSTLSALFYSAHSVAYSPDGRYIISGSHDRTIRIWDAETGTAVGEPLEGHTDRVNSVAFSPDGRYIISGSDDRTIRTWDAETGAAVGQPLEGHTAQVTSVAYSPDGRCITSGSFDHTIRIWDAEAVAAAGLPIEGRVDSVHSVAYSPDGRQITSGSYDQTIRVWDAETGAPVGKPKHADLYSTPDLGGWVRDSEGGLLYWVPQECRKGLHSPARLTIPLTSPCRSVSLDFDDFSFGTSWTQIFESAAS